VCVCVRARAGQHGKVRRSWPSLGPRSACMLIYRQRPRAAPAASCGWGPPAPRGHPGAPGQPEQRRGRADAGKLVGRAAQLPCRVLALELPGVGPQQAGQRALNRGIIPCAAGSPAGSEGQQALASGHNRLRGRRRRHCQRACFAAPAARPRGKNHESRALLACARQQPARAYLAGEVEVKGAGQHGALAWR
jgi:hypothetical protein